MIASRLFKSLQQRGIQQVLATSQRATHMPFYNTPVRFFSNTEEGSGEENASGDEVEETPEPEPVSEPEPVPEPEPTPAPQAQPAAQQAAPMDPLDRSLFQPFSVGNIKVIESTPDHKPPSEEDTIEGRYSGVLFTTASQNGDLYNVYEDLRFMQEIYRNSEQFRLFTENGGVGSKEIAQLNAAL